jgi:hypothetical protein
VAVSGDRRGSALANRPVLLPHRLIKSLRTEKSWKSAAN